MILPLQVRRLIFFCLFISASFLTYRDYNARSVLRQVLLNDIQKLQSDLAALQLHEKSIHADLAMIDAQLKSWEQQIRLAETPPPSDEEEDHEAQTGNGANKHAPGFKPVLELESFPDLSKLEALCGSMIQFGQVTPRIRAEVSEWITQTRAQLTVKGMDELSGTGSIGGPEEWVSKLQYLESKIQQIQQMWPEHFDSHGNPIYKSLFAEGSSFHPSHELGLQEHNMNNR